MAKDGARSLRTARTKFHLELSSSATLERSINLAADQVNFHLDLPDLSCWTKLIRPFDWRLSSETAIQPVCQQQGNITGKREALFCFCRCLPIACRLIGHKMGHKASSKLWLSHGADSSSLVRLFCTCDLKANHQHEWLPPL